MCKSVSLAAPRVNAGAVNARCRRAIAASVSMDRTIVISSMFSFICAYMRAQHTDASVVPVAPAVPTGGTRYDDIVTFQRRKSERLFANQFEFGVVCGDAVGIRVHCSEESILIFR